MTHGDIVICAAIGAAKLYSKDRRAACRALLSECKLHNLEPPANPADFIRTWQGRLDAHGNVLHASHNSGRPRKLTVQMVEQAYQAIIGWRSAGRKQPYASRAAAAAKCPTVKRVLQLSRATLKTLMNRIRELHPKFGRKLIKFKWFLSAENMADRVEKCEELRLKERALLSRVVHLDAKTVKMGEKAVWGLVDLDVQESWCNIEPAEVSGKSITLKYYAAVNAKLGAFFITFYTGTTGMRSTRDGLNYKVSQLANNLGLPPPFTYNTASLSCATQAAA